MGSSVEGDYFETCTCDVSCPCINMQPTTKDTCDTEVMGNAPFGAVTQPLTQARAGNVGYHGAWDVEFSGTNSFSTTFAYSG